VSLQGRCGGPFPGLFRALHDQRYQKHDQINDGVILGIRKELGLMGDDVENAVTNPQARGIIERDVKEGIVSPE
jgi:hypothetical protein